MNNVIVKKIQQSIILQLNILRLTHFEGRDYTISLPKFYGMTKDVVLPIAKKCLGNSYRIVSIDNCCRSGSNDVMLITIRSA